MKSTFSRILKTLEYGYIISDPRHYNYEVPTTRHVKYRILVEVDEGKSTYE